MLCFSLTLFRQKEFPPKSSESYKTVRVVYIVYIKGSKVIIEKEIKCIFLSLMIDLIEANSADPDEMPHYPAFHLDLHCKSTCSGVFNLQRFHATCCMSCTLFRLDLSRSDTAQTGSAVAQL